MVTATESLPCGGFMVAAGDGERLLGYVRVEIHFGEAVCVAIESDGSHGLLLRLLRSTRDELRGRGYSSVLAFIPKTPNGAGAPSGIQLRRLYSRLGFEFEGWLMRSRTNGGSTSTRKHRI